MSPTAAALVGYATWSLFLVVLIGVHRSALVLAGKHAASGYAVDGSDVSPFAERLSRVHANCYESLPAFGALARFTG